MRHVSLLARVAAVVVVLVVGPFAGLARAHGSTSLVQLALAEHDGGTTVRAFLVYENDNEPVTDELVVGEATSGTTKRTITLAGDRSTPGLYVGKATLAAGKWNLLVQAKATTAGFASADFTVTPDHKLADVTTTSALDDSTTANTALTKKDQGFPIVLVATGVGLVLVFGAAGLLLVIGDRKSRRVAGARR